MQFSLASLIALVATIQLVRAEFDCCVFGGPNSCEIISTDALSLGTFVKGNFAPEGAKNVVDGLPMGPGPVCCCLKQGDGPDACDYCVRTCYGARRESHTDCTSGLIVLLSICTDCDSATYVSVTEG